MNDGHGPVDGHRSELEELERLQRFCHFAVQNFPGIPRALRVELDTKMNAAFAQMIADKKRGPRRPKGDDSGN